MWLDNERREFKPGTLIIHPKGVAHAGKLVSSAPVKGGCDQTPAATGERHGISEPGFHQVVHHGFRLLRLRPHPDEAPTRRFRQFPKIYFKTSEPSY